MKTFKKVLASALAAAMVVTAFPVTNAEAATKAKLSTKKATIYVGQSKTIKVTLPKGAKITSVKTSKKAVATVKKSGKKVVVKAVKAGKATVTVKVTPKKGKATNLKATITVKNEAIRVSGASVIAVGETATLKTSTAPKGAAVSFKSSDDTIATVDEKGVVTAVKAGKVTITATAGSASKDIEIEVKNAILKDVKQTEVNKIVATIAGNTKDLKAADFKITNTATNATVAVKAATADKKDASKVAIDTFTDMKDAKEYSVVYDGVTVKFTATDGTPAKVGVDTVQIAAATKTPVKATLADANGVILGRTTLDSTDATKGNVTSEVKLTKGYQDGTNLYLPTVGDTATIKVTYHTGTFGTDGKETGNIEDTFTVTAVDPSLINYNFAVTISGSTPAWTAASFKANDKIAMGADKDAYFRITKDDGTEIAGDNYGDYTVESADKTKLLVNNTKLTNSATAVKVHGVSEGTTYILIKKDDKTVASLPVTVLAKPVATTVDLSKAAVTVVSGAAVTESVKVSVKDQYGDAMTDSTKLSVTESTLSAPKNASGVQVSAPALTISGDTVSVVGSSYTTLGTYQYKLTVKYDGKELTRTFTVNAVKSSATVQSYEVRVSSPETDTTVGKTDNVTSTSKQFTVSVAELANGGALDETSAVIYTIKDAAGKVIYHDGATSVATENRGTVTTSSAISYEDGKLTVNPYTIKTAGIVKNFVAGTYSVQAKVANGTKVVTVNGSFTIKDTQDSRVSFKLLKNDFGKDTSVASGFAIPTNVEVYYDGQKQDNTKLAVDNVKGYVLNNGNGGAFIKTVTVFVNVSGTEVTDGNMVQVTLTVNDQLASCSKTGISEQ